jgi:hypothetical protein
MAPRQRTEYADIRDRIERARPMEVHEKRMRMSTRMDYDDRESDKTEETHRLPVLRASTNLQV